jgi:hypothetical protein
LYLFLLWQARLHLVEDPATTRECESCSHGTLRRITERGTVSRILRGLSGESFFHSFLRLNPSEPTNFLIGPQSSITSTKQTGSLHNERTRKVTASRLLEEPCCRLSLQELLHNMVIHCNILPRSLARPEPFARVHQ